MERSKRSLALASRQTVSGEMGMGCTADVCRVQMFFSSSLVMARSSGEALCELAFDALQANAGIGFGETGDFRDLAVTALFEVEKNDRPIGGAELPDGGVERFEARIVRRVILVRQKAAGLISAKKSRRRFSDRCQVMAVFKQTR
jgi:hypothetical protein